MQLQFLNLSQPPRGRADQFVNGRPVRVFPDGNTIEAYFSFTMACDPNDSDKTRSKVRDLRICNEFTEHLRRAGFQVGKVRPAKPFGGIFCLITDRLEVTVILSAARRPRIVQCGVLTWTRSRPKGPVEIPAVEAEWTRTIDEIERVITQYLKGGPVVWNRKDDTRVESN